MAEVGDTGYVLKPANEWYAEERQRYLDIDAEWSLDPATPDGLKAAWDAEIFAGLDETLLAVYNSRDPDKAAGADLDVLCYLAGLPERDAGTASTVTLTLSGTPGTFVSAGKRVQTGDSSSTWVTLTDVTLTGGAEDVTAASVELGAVTADAGSITVIIDAVAGWTAVTNAGTPSVGRAAQTNGQRRLQLHRGLRSRGTGYRDAVYSAITALAEIAEAAVIPNRLGVTDPNGIDPYSLAIAVLPVGAWSTGLETEVAGTIYRNLPPCVPLFADTPTSVSVTSEVHPSHSETVVFQKVEVLSPGITVNVGGGGLPAVVADEIASAIADFFTGVVFTGIDGFNQQQPQIGGTFHWSWLLAPIQFVLGRYSPTAYVASIIEDGGSTDLIGESQVLLWTQSLRLTAGDVTVTL